MLRELEATLWRWNLILAPRPTDRGGIFPDLQAGIVAAVAARIVDLNEQLKMEKLTAEIKTEYADVFGPVPHVDALPEHEFCRVRLRTPTLSLTLDHIPRPINIGNPGQS
jgi:hypothetical protein